MGAGEGQRAAEAAGAKRMRMRLAPSWRPPAKTPPPHSPLQKENTIRNRHINTDEEGGWVGRGEGRARIVALVSKFFFHLYFYFYFFSVAPQINLWNLFADFIKARKKHQMN